MGKSLEHKARRGLGIRDLWKEVLEYVWFIEVFKCHDLIMTRPLGLCHGTIDATCNNLSLRDRSLGIKLVTLALIPIVGSRSYH